MSSNDKRNKSLDTFLTKTNIKMKTSMQWSYLFKHWSATLLLPLLLTKILYNESIELLTIGFLFGFIFSLPTYAFYALIFKSLQEETISISLKKIILIGISVFGICVTFALMSGDLKGVFTYDVFIYIISSLITGFFFRLGKKSKTKL